MPVEARRFDSYPRRRRPAKAAAAISEGRNDIRAAPAPKAGAIVSRLKLGASSRSGGLGWFIFENRNELETPSVFAGLLTVILIGLLVESVIFRTIEDRTVRKWGMQR